MNSISAPLDNNARKSEILNLRFILTMTLILTGIHKIIVLIYGNSESFFDQIQRTEAKTLFFLGVFFNHYLVQIVTVIVVLLLTRFYIHLWKKKDKLEWNVRNILKYELFYLPVPILAFFIFNPVVVFLHNAFIIITQTYDMFTLSRIYQMKLILAFTLPTYLVGYVALNWDFFKVQFSGKIVVPEIFIEGSDGVGVVPIKLSEISWFFREGRKYFAVTGDKKYRIKENLTALEKTLPVSKFIRVNRYTLVNVNFIKNYSYWEDEKYVVRMNDANETEFPMTRERLKKIKITLGWS